MTNILIIGEGSTDIHFMHDFFKKYLSYYLPNKTVKYIKDISRNAEIVEVSDSNSTSNIVFKNATSPNIKSFVDFVEGNGSLEKAYSYPPRSFAAVYSLFDLDLGSTNSDNLDNYFALVDTDEIIPIISYPSFEAEAFSTYFTEISQSWNFIKKEDVINIPINERIHFIENLFCFKSDDQRIASYLKKVREDLFSSKFSNVCSRTKRIDHMILCSKLHTSFYFSEDLIENHNYYLTNQKEIFENIKSRGKFYPMITFFLSLCEEIRLLLSDE